MALAFIVACGQSPGSPTARFGSEQAPLSVGTGRPGSFAPTASDGGVVASPSLDPVGSNRPAERTTEIMVTTDQRRLPIGISRGVALPDGTDVLLAGGLTAAGSIGTVFRIPGSGSPIAPEGSLARPVHDAAGVTLGADHLVLGGGVTTQATWVQDVVAGRGSVVGSLPAPRADLGAVVVGSEAIVVGGGAAGAADPRVLATTDGVHFRVVGRLPIPVRYAAIAAVGGLVFVIGGAARSGDVASIQVVDVAAGSARTVGHLPAPVSHATALVIGNGIVVAGGRHGGRAIDLIQWVDPSTLRVTVVGHLPRPMSDAAGVSLPGVAYLVGGEDVRPLATIVEIRLRVGS